MVHIFFLTDAGVHVHRMVYFALILFSVTTLSCVYCRQEHKPDAHHSVVGKHFDIITEKWHQKLHREIDEEIHRLKTTHKSTTVHHYTTTNPKDREAMAALYNATNGQHWINNTRWMKGDPCIDEWHGLYCIGGRVLQINMTFNNMSGTLPAELAQADMLQVVQLHNNSLTGTIPAEILQMKSLQILNLHYNRLTGGLPDSISMPNLTFLTVNWNQMNGNLTSQWNTPLLQVLDVGSNHFTGHFPDLSGCSKLQVLVASGNMVSGQYPSSLGVLQNLKKLWLSYNNFIEPEIPYSWSGLESLQDVQLDGVSGKIPSFIGEAWKKLVHLWITYGTLTGEFSTSLCIFQQLEDINLSGNYLSGTLPTCICQLTSLNFLDLSDNHFTGSIPYCLGSLSELGTLFLSRNYFSGILPTSIGNLTKLQVLYIDGNGITGTVPATYAGLTNIFWLTLESNKLYKLEDGLEPLYDRINKPTQCSLSNNPWSCPLPKDVPASCSAKCSLCNTGNRHTSCVQCVTYTYGRLHCGWCNEGPNCLDGSASGPHNSHQCKPEDWSYGSNTC